MVNYKGQLGKRATDSYRRLPVGYRSLNGQLTVGYQSLNTRGHLKDS